jgi:RNA polymerase primary sigma factor
MSGVYSSGTMKTKWTTHVGALDQYMHVLDSRGPLDAAEEERLTLRLARLREKITRLLERLPEPHRRHILDGARLRRDMRFAQIEVLVIRLAREAQERRDTGLQAAARRAQAILQDLSAARSTLVTRNLRLVYHLARRLVGRGALLADLVQVGNLALLDAADRFDPRRGTRFSTYAGTCISAVILRKMPGLTQGVHVPGYQMRLRSRLEQSRRSLTQDLGREPTLAEMAAQARLGEDKAREILAARPTLVDLYAHEPDSGRRAPADTLAAEDATTVQERLIVCDLIDHLHRILDSFDPRLRTVLQLRYGLDGEAPRTLEEIGDTLHLTRERIRQLEKEAMKLLRLRMKRLDAFTPACFVRQATAEEH